MRSPSGTVNQDLVAEIHELKTGRGAAILAHN